MTKSATDYADEIMKLAEENNRYNGGSWDNWPDGDELLYVYGEDVPENIREQVASMLEAELRQRQANTP